METRAFGGRLTDARGILEVDKSTLGGGSYTAEYIVALESDPARCVWIAEQEGLIVGFVSAFPTHSLAASRWEVDELAVRPEARGQGVGSKLVEHAVREGEQRTGLSMSRALVAVNNVASKRVFTKNGFVPTAEVDLLLYCVAGRVSRPPQAGLPTVREAQAGDAGSIARLSGCAADRVERLMGSPGNVYMVVEDGAGVEGYIEMVRVCTLQYRGFWIESLAVSSGNHCAAQALLNAAIEKTKSDSTLDEVGYLVSAKERLLHDASVGQGFRNAGAYLVFAREAATT